MKQITFMEVCGTHTMAIARSGIRSILPEGIRLLSGPGCPVCVTPPETIDAILHLSERENVLIATYGDMFKVPGSRKGDSLAKRKALGACVEMVYSPMDALSLAQERPEKEVVFLGVGFETTAPGTAACIKAAKEQHVTNFSVFSMLKRIEPALRSLSDDDLSGTEGRRIDGFLCPGHVAVILGEDGFRFLEQEYHMPAVIAGFEPEEILTAVRMLADQIRLGEGKLENAYRRAVAPEGNILAKKIMREVFVPEGALWRGLGWIENSGLKIREEFAAYDAAEKCAVPDGFCRSGTDVFAEGDGHSDSGYAAAAGKDRCHGAENAAAAGKDRCHGAENAAAAGSACRCGDVICGRMEPEECPMFGTACTPADPEGPCMVSSEGACAAAYKYRSAEIL